MVETEAIVLRTYRLGEADKVAVCLTRASGLIRGVAKGARKLLSRFGAGLEPFTLVNLTYFEKEGRELVSLRQVDILRSYFDLAKSAEAFAVLEYLAGLAVDFAPPNQADEKMFRMVRACVEAAAECPGEIESVATYYEIWILKLAGLLPELRACGGCGKRFGREGERVWLSFESAARCAGCAGGRGVALDASSHSALLTAQTLPPAGWARRHAPVEARLKGELSGFTRRLIERALEREPRGRAARGATAEGGSEGR